MSGPTLSEKLDRLIGEVSGMRETMKDQSDAFSQLSGRMVLVEKEIKSTKEVFEAWSAAKVWLRWAKWIAGFLAVLVSIVVSIKEGWFK